MTDSVAGGLDRALEGAFTRRIPQSAQAQMKFLVKQEKGTRAVAALLGISQRTVERYVKGQLKRPRAELRDRIAQEVRKRWQPKVRERAKQKAATTDGIVLSTRARFGFTAAPGTTDDARVRDITQALPPDYADRLFTARDQGATEEQLRRIAAEGLAEMYFRANNTRAGGLAVEFSDIDRLDIGL
ncbi:telomere-protecting terminal protein Tpg [Streptomyces sp. NPDC060194]|uniref:telomere-protecting terminal protein Tpg n=1 Tax=Streptomyces sp. NPDC060194 TaxID=3347069 RepID=UPI003661B047